MPLDSNRASDRRERPCDARGRPLHRRAPPEHRLEAARDRRSSPRDDDGAPRDGRARPLHRSRSQFESRKVDRHGRKLVHHGRISSLRSPSWRFQAPLPGWTRERGGPAAYPARDGRLRVTNRAQPADPSAAQRPEHPLQPRRQREQLAGGELTAAPGGTPVPLDSASAGRERPRSAPAAPGAGRVGDRDRDHDHDHEIVSMLTISPTDPTRAGLAPGVATLVRVLRVGRPGGASGDSRGTPRR